MYCEELYPFLYDILDTVSLKNSVKLAKGAKNVLDHALFRPRPFWAPLLLWPTTENSLKYALLS